MTPTLAIPPLIVLVLTFERKNLLGESTARNEDAKFTPSVV